MSKRVKVDTAIQLIVFVVILGGAAGIAVQFGAVQLWGHAQELADVCGKIKPQDRNPEQDRVCQPDTTRPPFGGFIIPGLL